jgi:phytoene/squalene synthetase
VSDIVSKFDLPIDPFDRLIVAFERDVTQHRFPTFGHVLDYCVHSANPVGELVLRLFRAWTPDRGKWSDDICTALQLANFWQDVSVDARKDRIYAPLEDLAKRGVSEREYLEGPCAESHRALMAFQVDRTRDLFRRGRALLDEAPPVPRRWLRAVWLGGMRVLEKIEARRWDVWSGRPALTALDGPVLLARWLLWRRP